MPLSPVSPNLQASEAAPSKSLLDRSIDATDSTTCYAALSTIDCENIPAPKSPVSRSPVECQPQLSGIPAIKMDSPESSPLSEVGSITPDRGSPSPNDASSKTPANSNHLKTLAKPAVTTAVKRKHAAVTEDKAKERAEKKQKQDEAAAEKARVAAEKAAEKERKAAEKATKAAEKARADAEKEAARAAKAAEKAKADAAKEAKRLKKQEEELAAKAKQEKQRSLMAGFLKKAPTTPSKTSDHPTPTTKIDIASPSAPKREAEPTKSAYELNFKPFFVKPGVTLAAPPFEMDDETKEAKSSILDEYIRGDRGQFVPRRPFDAAEAFNLAFPQQRGIIPPSVKKIMETIYGDDLQNTFGIANTRNESQTEKLFVNAQGQLNAVPMKYLRFYEDVRPAYFGTVTTPMTCQKLRKLSRRPVGKILPLSYDYDSEAEWVEDDGEDLDDAEDEEEDIDGDEEMDDFVDDSEAVPTVIRPGFEADSQPISTGLCFENGRRLGPSSIVYKFRLEFLLDTLEHHSMINPFSSEYWPAPVKKAAAVAPTSSAQGAITSMLPPAAPRDPAAPNTTSTASTSDLKDGVPREILEDFKRALLSDECKDYSKGTVIEVLAKKFTTCTKAQVKATLDTIAHRITPPNATKKTVKIWALLPNNSPKSS